MQCPSCGSPRVYPSRLRNSLERLWQRVTDKEPYRCHACNWRKWSPVIVREDGPAVKPDDLRTGRTPTPLSARDLDQLDTPSKP